mmetsp:Transcript_90912/g.142830  ORF Transcript_90912/g.142830 Transcript_90912/m.142830 type:complete len:354 (+) Transcript_90912:87-1148(+)
MTLLSHPEETWHYDENITWRALHAQRIEDLEGEWVNADSPLEQYVVQGLNVTRTDWRGTQHFTLQWDQQHQHWQWGTHGKLHLEWRADDTIAWVPNATSKHSRVWQWRRRYSPSGRQVADASELTFEVSSYGPGRRPRINHVDQPYPHQPISNPWSAPTNQLPPGPTSPSTVARRIERTPRGWDSFGSYQDDGHASHRLDSWDTHRDHRHYRNNRGHHRDHYGYHRRPRVDTGYYNRLPCGLSSNEVYSLLHREITPEDYDLLLRLDEDVPKQTASAESVAGLRKVLQDEFMGAECSVCLAAFAAEDAVVALPCSHIFHRSCITKWLSECRKKCPLCGVEVVSAGAEVPNQSA